MLRYHPWTFWCLIVGTFGQVGYLAHFMHPAVPFWLAAPVFLLPIGLVIFVQDDVAPERWVRRAHLLASVWYGCVTLVIEAMGLLGDVPDGELLMRLLMHLGWLHYSPLLYDWVRAIAAGEHSRRSAGGRR